MRLLAISDLHLGHAANRAGLAKMSASYQDDWLLLAGDVGEYPAQLELALDELQPRFRQIVWTPGNHDLWKSRENLAPPDPLAVTGAAVSVGQARYDELVAICRRRGVLTPDDPFVEWPGEPGTFIAPLFLLYDYSFRPPDVPLDRAVAWARDTNVVCSDEFLLDPSPWPSRVAWCEARCADAEARLAALPRGARTVLVNHWPLRHDLARPPRIPRFSIWSGTAFTEDWGRRFSARAVVSGHLHFRTTLWRRRPPGIE